MMKGTIFARSQVGQGSCFSIHLPLVQVCHQSNRAKTEQRRLAVQTVHFQPANVLLVDDIESNRLLIKAYLEPYPELHIIEAATAKQALDLVATQSFGLILMDKRLPDLHGNEVCQKIRAMPGQATTPIIMITASAIVLPASQQKLFYNLKLNKPITKMDLLLAMQTLLPLDNNTEINSPAVPTATSVSSQITSSENRAKLLELLTVDYQEQITKINASGAFEIDALIEIAEQLLKLAAQYQQQALTDWANTLQLQAQLFDIANLAKTLARFDSLLEQLQ
jgi:CheY-like chemotaxis protein